jgi:hypothetical protein
MNQMAAMSKMTRKMIRITFDKNDSCGEPGLFARGVATLFSVPFMASSSLIKYGLPEK